MFWRLWKHPDTNYRLYISKNHFHPGGVAMSDWTRSVRAIRDTPIADYSAPGANTTCHVAYRPLITLSPFLLALSVSYCKWTIRDHMSEWVHCVHQQNVNRSGSHTQTSQSLWLPSPVLLSTSRCSQIPLELSKVLSDSARAFSGAPESTCSHGGAFMTLWDLTVRIVRCWSSWDRCPALRETWCRILKAVVLRVP